MKMINLRPLRKEAKLTQKQLRFCLNNKLPKEIGESVISSWERGEVIFSPTDPRVIAVCEILECSLDKLSGKEELEIYKPNAKERIRRLNIFLLRTEKGISVLALAEEVGVARQYLSSYFDGHCGLSDEVAEKIAIFFNVETSSLEKPLVYEDPQVWEIKPHNPEYTRMASRSIRSLNIDFASVEEEDDLRDDLYYLISRLFETKNPSLLEKEIKKMENQIAVRKTLLEISEGNSTLNK